MRCARLFGGTIAFLVVAASTFGQATTYAVKVPQADVRSGPSDALLHYTTNRLRQGDTVEAVGQEQAGGWLPIKPPAGSFSWVNTRFVRPYATNKKVWIVESEAPVDVLYGSALRQEKPIARSAQLQRGTILESIGATMTADDGIWLPIKPPPSEVRYIRASDLTPNRLAAAGSPAGPAPPASVAVSSNWDQHGVPLVPAPSSPDNRSAGAPQALHDPRLDPAEQAEREGRISDAIELYSRLGQSVSNTNYDLAMYCYNRANALRRGNPAVSQTRLRPVAAGAARQSAAYAPQACCIPCQQNQFAFRGQLRVAGQSLDRKRTYALQDMWGRTVAYVTAAGANLEPYVNKFVEVNGAAWYRGDVRANYVQASRVTPIQ